MTASPAMQEYLAEAYRLAFYQTDDPYISTSALADVLHVSPPAVTRMVQRLKEAGFLDHEPYRGIRLTPLGEREALMSIRKHRLVERFLVDVMGFGWHEVHDAADSLGATVSDMVVNRMDDLTGHPRRCPHGEPIPTADGHMPRIVDTLLTEVAADADYVVSRCNTHDVEKLRYLASLGLTPGASIRLDERAPFHGPLHVRVGNQTHFLGYELAQVLRVCAPHEFGGM
jgi:DtxR family transcriptional regulator, Mn-dependent transcriptional regulator